MKLIEIKSTFCLVLMIVILIMSFITKDVVNSQLLASLALITGAYATRILSTQNSTTDEKY